MARRSDQPYFQSDLNERLGFTSLAESAARTDYKGHKLTIEEVNGYDMAAHIQEVVAAA